jgi:hypothetical protein
MNRRAFIACLGGLGAGWPLRCHAQSPSNPTPLPQRGYKPLWGGWKERPSIVTVSEESDPRLKAVYEARDFWNAELLKLGSSFRLGAVTHVGGHLDVKEFHPEFRRVSHNPFSLPEMLRKIDGDVIVALSDDSFYAFTIGWLSPKTILVGIQNEQTHPLTMPNGAANVIAHELGHVIGLGHNENPNALMCGSSPWCRYDFSREAFLALTDHEKTRLIEMYPPDWQETPRRWKGDALRNAG